jgi:propanediol utilization protein
MRRGLSSSANRHIHLQENSMNKLKLIAAAVSLLVAGTVFAQNATPVVTERQENQKARIDQGVKSGELTKREAARLRAEQRGIRAEKRMAKADGVVTAQERAKLRHDQNRASRHIYRQKHDAQKRS